MIIYSFLGQGKDYDSEQEDGYLKEELKNSEIENSKLENKNRELGILLEKRDEENIFKGPC